MERTELEQRLHHTIANVNMDGLELLNKMFGGMEETEMYNINTSEERIEEIKQEKAKEEAERKARKEAEPSPYTLNPTMQMLSKQYSFEMIGDKGFEEIRNIISARPHTATMDTAIDVFALGYIYGKRAERKRRRGVHHGR